MQRRVPTTRASSFSRYPKDQRISQALNRLTFGPRPGDAAQVRAMGLKKWIDLQLHPEQIPENPVLTAKLKEFDTLSMTQQRTGAQLSGAANGETDGGRADAVSHRSGPPPGDRETGGAQRAKTAAGGGRDAAPPNAPDVQPLREILTPEQMRSLRTGTPQQRLAAFQALPAGQAGRGDRGAAAGRCGRRCSPPRRRNCGAGSNWPPGRSRWWRAT